MTQPILIGIHGVKRAGKNTTADFIEKFAAGLEPARSVVQRGFADKGKLAFARQFFPRISMAEAIKWCDKFKLIPQAQFTSPGMDLGHKWPNTGPLHEAVIFRDALAQFCTEGARDIYGEDHWVDQLLPRGSGHRPNWHREFTLPSQFGIGGGFRDPNEVPKLHKHDEVADFCLITDNRFPNEIKRIKEFGGWTIKIRRNDADDAVIAEAAAAGRDVHRSELGIPDDQFDFVINNDDNDLKEAEARTKHVFDAILRSNHVRG